MDEHKKLKMRDTLFKSIILDVAVICFSLRGQTSELCRQTFEFPRSEWANMLSIALKVASERNDLSQHQINSIKNAQKLLRNLNNLSDILSVEEFYLGNELNLNIAYIHTNMNALALEIHKLNKLLEICQE